MKELSLRPYHGRLFIAKSRKEFKKQHKKLFKRPDVLTCVHTGRFVGEGTDGLWTYLIWSSSTPTLAHELSHVILHVFELSGIAPIEASGEPFCYMLSQLMLDARSKK